MGVLRVCCLRLFGHVLRLKGDRHRLAHPRIEIRQTHRLTAAQTSYAAKLQKKNQKIVILSQKTFPFLFLTFPLLSSPLHCASAFLEEGRGFSTVRARPSARLRFTFGWSPPRAAPARAAPASARLWVCLSVVAPPRASRPPRVFGFVSVWSASPRSPPRVLAVLSLAAFRGFVFGWVPLARPPLIPNSPFPIPN